MKPVVLCILDGWGHREDADDNAISRANTPFWDKLAKTAPYSLLETSGLAVGLPEGQMGNSEVGHMNIGSGRIIMQSLPMIDEAIKTGELANKPQIKNMIKELKVSGKACHLLGLLSVGGVHSHQSHIAALAKIIASEGVKVYIHAFLDGRDVAPQSALEYIKEFNSEIAGNNLIKIATASGRYYAMDRDKRWDRVELAYNAFVLAEGNKAATIEQAVENSYAEKITDEFIKPAVIGDYHGMQDGDALIMVNFRSDRARQTLSALVDGGFNGFARKKTVKFSDAIGMVEYSEDLNRFLKTLFPPVPMENILGEVIANAGLKQLRIAETEKYAHVTFFFNGGRESEFAGEERILIPSPSVATYDLKPEMSAFEVTDALVEAINSGKFDLLVVNYANTDMVGHTGFTPAALQAVEAVDKCIARVYEAVEKAEGLLFITADHGNSEQMEDHHTGQPHTAHTTNPVPFVMAGKDASKYKLQNGRLCDIAPTILKIMGIKKPEEMTGVELL